MMNILLLALTLFAAGGEATAQSLTVLPVTIAMAPGQLASTLTVINESDSETVVQIRVFAWTQPDGEDSLLPSDAVLISPPFATIAAGATQIIRLILRGEPQDREATYRILLDQMPPPAAPGTVQIALRLSIPIFAEPATRTVPRVQFGLEQKAGQYYLVAFNAGGRHETIRDIVLANSDGSALDIEQGLSPYVLAGATRYWRIAAPSPSFLSDNAFHLTAQADSGPIDQMINADVERP